MAFNPKNTEKYRDGTKSMSPVTQTATKMCSICRKPRTLQGGKHVKISENSNRLAFVCRDCAGK